jgi:hypothetical protein
VSGVLLPFPIRVLGAVHAFNFTVPVKKAKAVTLHAMKALGGEEVQLPLILDLGTRRG